uniref:Uncharacterized protein n=1 Tax=Oryza nivara TaxID=4536 RepID=A0A0E0IGP6_ORYNI
MGQGTPGGMGKQGGTPGERKSGGDGDKKERKFEPPPPPPRGALRRKSYRWRRRPPCNGAPTMTGLSAPATPVSTLDKSLHFISLTLKSQSPPTPAT